MIKDFIYLDVAGSLSHYLNPTLDWRRRVLAYAATEISFFSQHGLINESAAALRVPAEKAVIRFSDFTPEGQDFIMSQAVERWLGSCDRKGTIEAYQDPSGLVQRLNKFRKDRATVAQ